MRILTLATALLLAAQVGCRKHHTENAVPPASASVAEAPSASAVVPEPSSSALLEVPQPEVQISDGADASAPRGYERVTVLKVVDVGEGQAVLLADARQVVILPIFVGGTEATTIELRLEGEKAPRPLTHDLLSSLVRELGGRPVRSQIDELRGDVFIGSVYVAQGKRVVRLDARPSDGIALALGSKVPLFVSHEVMLGSGIPREKLESADVERELGGTKRPSPISM